MNNNNRRDFKRFMLCFRLSSIQTLALNWKSVNVNSFLLSHNIVSWKLFLVNRVDGSRKLFVYKILSLSLLNMEILYFLYWRRVLSLQHLQDYAQSQIFHQLIDLRKTHFKRLYPSCHDFEDFPKLFNARFVSQQSAPNYF